MIQIQEYKVDNKTVYDNIDIYGDQIAIHQNPTYTATFTQTFGEDLLQFFKKNNQISQSITIQDNQLRGRIKQPIGKLETDGFYNGLNVQFLNVFNIIENINIDYKRENYISDYDGKSYFGDSYSLQYNISVEKIANNPNVDQDQDFEKINKVVKDVLFLDNILIEVKGKRQVQYNNANYQETRYYYLNEII